MNFSRDAYLALIKRAAEHRPGSPPCNELWRFNHRLEGRSFAMARETWREYYRDLIESAAEAGRRGGMSGIELRKFIRGRSHPGRHGLAGAWGLKMWQQEFRVFRGLPRRKKRSTPAIPDLPGQLKLFGD